MFLKNHDKIKKKTKLKEVKLLTMRGVKHANLVNECFNYFTRSKHIFLYLDFCLFSDKTNEIAFHREVNAKSLWLVPMLLAYHSSVSLLLKSKPFTIENELENGRPVLNKYVHVDTSNKPLWHATKPNMHAYREMLPGRRNI